MGEIADWMVDKAIEQELEPTIDWEDLLESKTWLTAKRIRIPISEMATPHIKNVIKCLEGKGYSTIPHNWNGKTHQCWLELMKNELINRV